MSEAPTQNRRRGRFGPWLLLSLFVLASIGGLAVMSVTGQPLVAPGWLVVRLEQGIDHALAGKGHLSMGGAELVIERGMVPRVRLDDLQFYDPAGREIATLPELRVTLALDRLFHGELRPTSVTISGASVTLHRNVDGQLNLALGASEALNTSGVRNLGQALETVDNLFALPVLSRLDRIQADAMSMTLQDARAGRDWTVSDGRLSLVQDPSRVSIELGFGLAGGAGAPAKAVFTFVTQKGSPAARLGATVEGVASADIAAQSPALAWLKVLDAPISGEFRAAIDNAGQIGNLEGRMTIGAGAVRPADATDPVKFEHGALSFNYDPKAQKIIFSEASVQSAAVRVNASGQAYLQDFKGGLPQTFISQVKFDQVMIDPEKLFQEPVRFSQGALDVRLRLDPFDMTIGQLTLLEEGRRIEARGDIKATSAGWQVSLDSALDEISHDRLLALWPVDLVPLTREWLANNVQTGLLFNVKAALRLYPRQEPHLSLGYEFSNADVRFIRTMPPILQGRGYATIDDKVYTMVLDSGHVDPPKGGPIDVAGSTFTVPDIALKPPPAVVKLHTSSTITAALSLLDEPPLRLLTKARQPVDLAEGTAVTDAEIRLPLAEKVELPDITYSVTGKLGAVRSDAIVKGKEISAASLDLFADNSGIHISGSGAIGKVPFNMTWTQKFDPEDAGKSRIDGTVDLSQAFVDEFSIGLPAGSVTGQGRAQVTINLERDKAPTFHLVSDLNSVGLRLPELGWSKAPAATGHLEVGGTLGRPPAITQLSLDAAGLRAEGTVSVNPNGTLAVAHFPRVQLGGWLDGQVDLTGRGRGHSIGITVGGGALDLRKATFGKGPTQDQNVPMTVSLGKVTIADGISLTNFRGTFGTLGGFYGSFTASVNGATDISGNISPGKNGSEVRITSGDAGGVFAAVGAFSKARGGNFDMLLTPQAAAGTYDGKLTVSNIRVIQAPALAEILGAISVVGLLEQLHGSGIVFSDLDSEFRVTPNAVEIKSGSAIGPSLGVTMAGVYDAVGKTLNMQGVVSPIYLINGIGSILTRKGEGLFGFNYTLKGSSSDPKVSVNPFSILTPGMFRDLFRKPPPTLSK